MSIDRLYWDSAAFLAWLQSEKERAPKCAATLERAKTGELLIVTSALTLTEVLWTRGGPRLAKDKAATLRRFFRRSGIRVYNVTRAIAESAQDVVWDFSVKPKDAIHVATAMHLDVAILETFDEGLLKKNGKVGSPPLVIREPQLNKQGAFDFGEPEKSG